MNLRVGTLTAERIESKRLQDLVKANHFNRSIFPVPEQFKNCNATALLSQVQRDANAFSALLVGNCGFDLRNGYFTTPDAEILYSMVNSHRPRRVIEVGSGSSTRLFRAAISDHSLTCHLTSIDPCPRESVTAFADEIVRGPVEDVRSEFFEQLQANDILFVDSSHYVGCGSDVVYLMLRVAPQLKSGVIIHVHDVFLPYDYPADWMVDRRWNWNEQYLVQAMLFHGEMFDAIWPGHFIQKSRQDFASYFRNWNGQNASSLWLRKR